MHHFMHVGIGPNLYLISVMKDGVLSKFGGSYESH
jgi:hypothetical protein